MKKIIAFLATAITSTVGFMTLSTVEAQLNTQSKVEPAFTKVQNASKLNLQVQDKPFIPQGMEQSDNPDPSRALIGDDNRISMTSRKYPWSAIGKVAGMTANGGQYHCTGTLISPDVVLTNAHCVVDPRTHKFSQEIRFEPNLINGVVKDPQDIARVTQVIYGTDFTERNSERNDWAVLKLDKSIGNKYGYLSWKSIPSSTLIKNPNRLFMVGYSADRMEGNTAGADMGCSIVKEADELLFHECDTNGGASGGPIITRVKSEYYIVGLHSGANMIDKNQVINRAVKMSRLDEVFGS